MRPLVAVVFVGALGFGLLSPALAVDVSVSPVVNSQAVANDGTNYVVTSSSGTATLNAARFSGTPLERRTILEYALSGIPAGATITSASLNLSIASYTTGSQFAFHGYAGNGQANVSDATVPFNQVGLGTITNLGTLNVPISASYIQSLLGSSNYLGLMGYQNYLGGNASFWSTYQTSPALSISYVPEPGSVALLAIAGFIGLRRRLA